MKALLRARDFQDTFGGVTGSAGGLHVESSEKQEDCGRLKLSVEVTAD